MAAYLHTNVAPFIITDTYRSPKWKFNPKVVFVFVNLLALYIGDRSRDLIDQLESNVNLSTHKPANYDTLRDSMIYPL
ncbi:uncharacterized protein Bfra_009920 [Botrytis fragariae]|uniref:Uncharacterized protein n=1 Tax=Botrytis fragariae TaxID=1964551 RepID=A0A8H6AN12_9HELO|nr:uncharacterized protein Bfra_009920 [Botrytis fragariae]KAF5870532.1 hypothetical protein Bfra_009920 [Botrytis fragariae]